MADLTKTEMLAEIEALIKAELGPDVTVELPCTDRIDAVEETAAKFMRDVFGIDYSRVRLADDMPLIGLVGMGDINAPDMEANDDQWSAYVARWVPWFYEKMDNLYGMVPMPHWTLAELLEKIEPKH